MNNYGFYSLIPVLVTLFVALVFRRIGVALLLGILTASFVFAHFSIWPSLKQFFYFMLSTFSDTKIWEIVIFIFLMGVLLKLLATAGIFYSFAEYLKHIVVSAKRARLATWIIGLLTFFSDFTTILISSASMRKTTDTYQISIPMMAYLIASVSFIPSFFIISTWSSFSGGIMKDSGHLIGINDTLTQYLLNALPYHFSSYFVLFLSLLVAITGKWFSRSIPIRKIPDEHEFQSEKLAHVSYFFLPLAIVIGLSLAGFFLSGAVITYFKKLSITMDNIIENAMTITCMVFAVAIALFFSSFLFWKNKILTFKSIFHCFYGGMFSMGVLGIIIILANGFGEISGELGVGAYIAEKAGAYITKPFVYLAIYLVSLLVTMTTGYCWGSIAIVIPFAFNFAYEMGEAHAIPAIAATVISASVLGAQLVPYSGRILLTSKACDIPPFHFLKFSFWQFFCVLIITFIAYILYGFTHSIWLSYLFGFAFIGAMHFFFSRLPKREEPIGAVEENIQK